MGRVVTLLEIGRRYEELPGEGGMARNWGRKETKGCGLKSGWWWLIKERTGQDGKTLQTPMLPIWLSLPVGTTCEVIMPAFQLAMPHAPRCSA